MNPEQGPPQPAPALGVPAGQPGVTPQDITPVGGWREDLAQRSLRIPFRVKLAAVWIVILTVVGLLFAAVGFDLSWMGRNWAFILAGLPFTIVISAAAIVLAVVLALLGALGRLSKNPVAYGISGFYISFFRGTPLIVQLFLWFLGLAQIGSSLLTKGYSWGSWLILDAFVAGILALGFNYGAYMTEIFRAGIQSVGHGQVEAASALGMTYRQTMRRVVLPQAIRVIIPPTGNEFIAMLKDSALISFLGTGLSTIEIFRRAQISGRQDFRSLEALIIAAAVYWALTTVFSYFQGRLERRLSKGYVREAVHVIAH